MEKVKFSVHYKEYKKYIIRLEQKLDAFILYVKKVFKVSSDQQLFLYYIKQSDEDQEKEVKMIENTSDYHRFINIVNTSKKQMFISTDFNELLRFIESFKPSKEQYNDDQQKQSQNQQSQLQQQEQNCQQPWIDEMIQNQKVILSFLTNNASQRMMDESFKSHIQQTIEQEVEKQLRESMVNTIRKEVQIRLENSLKYTNMDHSRNISECLDNTNNHQQYTQHSILESEQHSQLSFNQNRKILNKSLNRNIEISDYQKSKQMEQDLDDLDMKLAESRIMENNQDIDQQVNLCNQNIQINDSIISEIKQQPQQMDTQILDNCNKIEEFYGSVIESYVVLDQKSDLQDVYKK